MPRESFSREKGQSLIELAFVFTLLLILIGGIIDLGSMFYTTLALRDTTQEGTIYAVAHPIDTTNIQNRIRASASFPIDASKITDISVTCAGSACSVSSTNSCQGQPITIKIGYDYRMIMPIIPVFIGRQTVALSSTVTATILQSTETIEALAVNNQKCP